MINNPEIPVPVSPVLLDLVVAEYQTRLADQLTWLTYAFGKAEKRTRRKDGQVIVYPAVYAGMGNYLSAMPDENLGNFCFFYFNEDEKASPQSLKMLRIDRTFSIIFWLNLKLVYPADYENRTAEHAKKEVLDAVTNIHPTQSAFRFTQFFEEPKNIYAGFTDQEIDSQYLMRPYVGFRLLCKMNYPFKPAC